MTLSNWYLKSSHLKIIFRDLFGLKEKTFSNKLHLQGAMQWLCRAQDISGCGGISSMYSFYWGWLPPYPETTGYIIPTFLRYAFISSDDNYIERAIMMGDWEIKIQLPCGGIRGARELSTTPIVFDTGQVILGWVYLFKKTKQHRFLEAAIKAADWLLSIQDNDGNWRKYTYRGIPHAYNTKVAWSLFEICEVTNNEKYRAAAEKNILWALSLAEENGWFRQMGITMDEIPPTHRIAYTLQGLIESSSYLAEDIKKKVAGIVLKAAENIIRVFEIGGKSRFYSKSTYLKAAFNSKWESKDNYSCLTGNAQLAIVFLKLFKINNDRKFLNMACKLIEQLKETQDLDCKNPGIRGGIAGSYPIWGKFVKFAYPNWATKFFADSIMLQESIIKNI